LLKAGQDADGIHYYRSKDGKEVDLVIDKVSRLVAAEVK
jgi:predicted AAA+ superfamily ATPase